MLTECDRAYMAGFMDGEGTITISDIRKYGCGAIRVTIYNIISTSLQPFAEAFGGSVRLHKRVQDKAGVLVATGGRIYKPKPLYVYDVRARKAEALLRSLLPYLRLKRQKAEWALAYRETLWSRHGRGQKLPITIHAERVRLRALIHNLALTNNPE